MAKEKRQKMSTELGSGNIFADMGDPDADRTFARSQLMHHISDIIRDHKLTQKQAAKILDLDQPRVSDLMNGKLGKFSMDALVTILNKLDRDVEIVIKPKLRETENATTRVLVLATP